jgi:hypothetical protein
MHIEKNIYAWQGYRAPFRCRDAYERRAFIAWLGIALDAYAM